MSNLNRVCLTPEPGDSNFFGNSVAINENYLVVGDLGANKVVIYTLDNYGQWSRAREIVPPADLAFDREGFMFGGGLELDGDVLTISARIKNVNSSKTNFSSSTVADILSQYSYKRYLINLKTDTEIHPIELLMQREPESNLIRFNLLHEGKIKQFVVPDPDIGINNLGSKEISPISKVGLHKNLLLVGYSSHGRTGGAFLFDLEQLETEPLKLTAKEATLGDNVAISEQFAVVGYHGIRWYFPDPDTIKRPFKTLIKNLNNGLVSVVQTFGVLSLSGNILAVMRPGNREEELGNPLQVFRIDQNNNLHLIMKQENLYQAKVENGFLVTIEAYEDVKLCVTPLSEFQ